MALYLPGIIIQNQTNKPVVSPYKNNQLQGASYTKENPEHLDYTVLAKTAPETAQTDFSSAISQHSGLRFRGARFKSNDGTPQKTDVDISHCSHAPRGNFIAWLWAQYKIQCDVETDLNTWVKFKKEYEDIHDQTCLLLESRKSIDRLWQAGFKNWRTSGARISCDVENSQKYNSLIFSGESKKFIKEDLKILDRIILMEEKLLDVFKKYTGKRSE